MKVSMRGWARDHGSKVLLSGRLAGIDAREDVPSYPYQGLTLEVSKLDSGRVEFIDVVGRATVTMNGDYLTRVRLSRKDIVKLAAIALRDMTFEEIVSGIGGIYRPEED